jgi:hypothetical protein
VLIDGDYRTVPRIDLAQVHKESNRLLAHVADWPAQRQGSRPILHRLAGVFQVLRPADERDGYLAGRLEFIRRAAALDLFTEPLNIIIAADATVERIANCIDDAAVVVGGYWHRYPSRLEIEPFVGPPIEVPHDRQRAEHD